MVFASGNADSRYVRLISWAGAVVSVNLLAGMIGYLIVTLNGDLRLSMIVLGVLTALLAPQLERMTVQKAWLVPRACACAGIVLIATGLARSGYDTQHPKPDSIFYLLDANAGRASWMSFDEQPDAWTSQFLSGKIETGTMTNLGWINDPFLKVTAPSLPLVPRELNVQLDSTAARLIISYNSSESFRSTAMSISWARSYPAIQPWVVMLLIAVFFQTASFLNHSTRISQSEWVSLGRRIPSRFGTDGRN